jgi:hypothetical protein
MWKGLCLKGCHESLLDIDGIEYERRCYQSITGVTHKTVNGYSSPAECLEKECTGDDNCLGIEWAFNVANVSHRRAREFHMPQVLTIYFQPPCWVAMRSGPTYKPATVDYKTYHALVKKGEVA